MTTWSKEPPKEPGWYWVRVRQGCTAPSWNSQGFIYGWTWSCKIATAVKRGYLWWPIPITPPSEEAPMTTESVAMNAEGGLPTVKWSGTVSIYGFQLVVHILSDGQRVFEDNDELRRLFAWLAENDVEMPGKELS